jgi:alpha-glucoside transport system permease protein
MADHVSTFAKKTKINTENHFSLGKLPIYVVLLLLVFLWTLPSFGLFVSSFRHAQQISNYGWWQVLGDFSERLNDEGEPRFRSPPPQGLTLDNYQRVLGTQTGAGGAMGSAFINSLLVVIPSTIIPITIAAFAAYAIAWLNWVGRRLALFIIVGLLVVPLQMSLIPILRIYTRLGLNGSFLGIWLGPYGLRTAIGDLYPVRIYLGHPGVHHRVGVSRRGDSLADLYQAHPAPVGARHRVIRHFPVPLGMERSACGPCIPHEG